MTDNGMPILALCLLSNAVLYAEGFSFQFPKASAEENEADPFANPQVDGIGQSDLQPERMDQDYSQKRNITFSQNENNANVTDEEEKAPTIWDVLSMKSKENEEKLVNKDENLAADKNPEAKETVENNQDSLIPKDEVVEDKVKTEQDESKSDAAKQNDSNAELKRLVEEKPQVAENPETPNVPQENKTVEETNQAPAADSGNVSQPNITVDPSVDAAGNPVVPNVPQEFNKTLDPVPAVENPVVLNLPQENKAPAQQTNQNVDAPAVENPAVPNLPQPNNDTVQQTNQTVGVPAVENPPVPNLPQDNNLTVQQTNPTIGLPAVENPAVPNLTQDNNLTVQQTNSTIGVPAVENPPAPNLPQDNNVTVVQNNQTVVVPAVDNLVVPNLPQDNNVTVQQTNQTVVVPAVENPVPVNVSQTNVNAEQPNVEQNITSVPAVETPAVDQPVGGAGTSDNTSGSVEKNITVIASDNTGTTVANASQIFTDIPSIPVNVTNIPVDNASPVGYKDGTKPAINITGLDVTNNASSEPKANQTGAEPKNETDKKAAKGNKKSKDDDDDDDDDDEDDDKKKKKRRGIVKRDLSDRYLVQRRKRDRYNSHQNLYSQDVDDFSNALMQ